ncbi:hypothetical protein E1287_22555 [Actinomadura sp. KC06]|uniref:hypothetical protein n=1 Tax=Actinomadura sp. KC06 TaxID=2530369 RepID=UPI00104AA892|nr:hypothetical protein [Actinomadura sp. KC06]TDD32472.1 hypothetical protein E1287_22555 [Actinomadura sp. KC06]
MTSLKRPNRPTAPQIAPVQPGPAPSSTLLTQFAQEADRKRMEAGEHKVTASTAAEAASVAQANADQLAEQLRPLMAEVDRIRAVLDEQTTKADEHRTRAREHEARAAELLNDVAYLDEIAARAGRPPAPCSCTAPDAGDAACPIHGTEAAS